MTPKYHKIKTLVKYNKRRDCFEPKKPIWIEYPNDEPNLIELCNKLGKMENAEKILNMNIVDFLNDVLIILNNLKGRLEGYDKNNNKICEWNWNYKEGDEK